MDSINKNQPEDNRKDLSGEGAIKKMKELGLGVKIKTEEQVEVDEDWFKSF